MRTLWSLTLFSAAMFVVACQPIQPPTPMPDEEAATVTPAAEATVAPAEEDLPEIAVQVRQLHAEERQIPAEEIRVVSVEEVEWPDACLGVSRPDELCAQVITPGYRVILEANGEEVEYHTDRQGNSIRLADGR